MLDIQQSDATQNEFNKKLIETKRKKGEDNVQWLNRNLPKKTPDNVFLVLVGGSDTPSIRLRSAQAYARHNLTPSNWSHILFLDTKTSVNEKTGTHEVSLSPPKGFGFPPEADNELRR